MITVQLKAKHFYLISDILFGIAAYNSFSTLEKIKTACTGVQDEDLVNVTVDVSYMVEVFNILTSKPEGQFNIINTEMINLLLPQISAGVTANNQEWIKLATQIQKIRENNWNVVTSMIASGKSKLFYQ